MGRGALDRPDIRSPGCLASSHARPRHGSLPPSGCSFSSWRPPPTKFPMRPSTSSSVVEQGQPLHSEDFPISDLHLRVVPFEVGYGDHALREHLQDGSDGLERPSVERSSVEEETGAPEREHWGLVAPTKRVWTAGVPTEPRSDEDGVSGVDAVDTDDTSVPDPLVRGARRDEEHRPLGRGRPRRPRRSNDLGNHEVDRITRDQKWERRRLPWLPLRGVPEANSDV